MPTPAFFLFLPSFKSSLLPILTLSSPSSIQSFWLLTPLQLIQSLKDTWLYVLSFKLPQYLALPRWCLQCRGWKRHGFDPWVRKIPWKRKWQPIPVFLPEESHGQRSPMELQKVRHVWSDLTRVKIVIRKIRPGIQPAMKILSKC